MLPACPYCHSQNSSSAARALVVRYGTYLRESDRSLQQRYRCRACERSFSSASGHPCFRQKKRHLNPFIFEHLASGISQRRLALLFRINRKTVVRKLLFLGPWALRVLSESRAEFPPSVVVEFDDLETFEHSKLKPLSVTTAVEWKSRRILGFRVAQMPAKGRLVKRALKKYGPRKDERRSARRELFEELKPSIHPHGLIKSDENPHYPRDVQSFFPQCTHQTFKGRRGCVVGQGELKAGGFDPLFSLNHSLAMFRANINRLFRRTWNTTKKKERLTLHLALYALFHNHVLLKT